MKKLIIAAGIAAATMASFNASAVPQAVFSAPSYASINTTVKADAYLSVTASDAEASVADMSKPGTLLGRFAVAQVGMDGLDYDKIAVDKIHTHGYGDGAFNIVLTGGATDCQIEAGTHTETFVGDDGAQKLQETCVFTVADASSITVKTGTNSIPVTAGVKTITAQFRAFHL
ncbi:hypothetical protein [Salmonella enterica]|uniref:hypothetical protein n=1 Tax=Salmonella enterica TaxID=28901 RepID=UPI00193D5771|nr:hypothetical protein [Salmonella enterica]EEN5589001.1 hypothetical protein [Salmonella enterica subsp. enterica serovar Mountpleasant]